MEYRLEQPFSGDHKQILDQFVLHLTPRFHLDERSDSHILMSNTCSLFGNKRDPMSGVSSVRVEAGRDQLILTADLSGIERGLGFAKKLIGGLVLFFLLFFGLGMGWLFGQQFGVGFGVPFAPGVNWFYFIVPIVLLPFSPWPILFPVIRRAWRQRAESALQTTLSNLASMST